MPSPCLTSRYATRFVAPCRPGLDDVPLDSGHFSIMRQRKSLPLGERLRQRRNPRSDAASRDSYSARTVLVRVLLSGHIAATMAEARAPVNRICGATSSVIYGSEGGYLGGLLTGVFASHRAVECPSLRDHASGRDADDRPLDGRRRLPVVSSKIYERFTVLPVPCNEGALAWRSTPARPGRFPARLHDRRPDSEILGHILGSGPWSHP